MFQRDLSILQAWAWNPLSREWSKWQCIAQLFQPIRIYGFNTIHIHLIFELMEKEKASRKARLIFLNFMGSIQPHTCMLCVWIEFLEFTTSIWDNISMQHSLIVGREVLILTLYILLTPQGCISWHIPEDGLMIREWPYTASNQDALGCTPPPTSRFPSALEMSLGTRDLSVVRDAQPNTSFLSAVYVYNTSRLEAVYGHYLIINSSLGMYQEIQP